MRVVTFYSYKGGVGRTLACANFGLYLAKMGQKVVLMDMDFEAPGLDSKFPSVEIEKVGAGVLDQFLAFQRGQAIPELPHATIPLPDDVVHAGGRLDVIPAGNYVPPQYYKDLSGMEWAEFTSTERGLRFCLDLQARIQEQFGADALAIDSRTGLTEIGGICTQVFPDSVLMFTCASGESLAGTRRIYKRIKESPVVKSRLHGRNEVDVRVIFSRLPRPDDLPALDRLMRERIALPVNKVYYLFDQRDLSLEEYLALDRFGENRPAILNDYVELFASLHPEMTRSYISGRLDAFRMGITRRSPQETERLIQELLTLFPVPEIFLEAARYYRQAKDGDAKAVANYIRYFDSDREDKEALTEFAQLCTTVSQSDLKPQNKVVRLLDRYGVTTMDALLLGRYLALSKSEDGRRNVVNAIESDTNKLESDDYRKVLVDALRALEEWGKILQTVADKGNVDLGMRLILAEACASVGRTSQAIEILKALSDMSYEDLATVLRILYKAVPEATAEQLCREFAWLDKDMLRYAIYRFAPASLEPGLKRWLTELSRQVEKE